MDAIRYRRPFPQMTDHDSTKTSCIAAAAGWLCTRPAGHDGRHEAGGARGQMYASWPASPEVRR